MPGSREGYEVERKIREHLEQELGFQLPKTRLTVGTRPDGSPNTHEFDLCSRDRSIVGEIKASPGEKAYTDTTRIAECCLDCLYLLSVKEAHRRIFVLNRRETYDAFRSKTAGLPLDSVEVRLIEV